MAFVATHSGLTRWQDFVPEKDAQKPKEHFSNMYPRAIDEIWYKRAVEQYYIHPDSFVYSVNVDEDGADNTTLVTASRAVFIGNFSIHSTFSNSTETFLFNFIICFKFRKRFRESSSSSCGFPISALSFAAAISKHHNSVRQLREALRSRLRRVLSHRQSRIHPSRRERGGRRQVFRRSSGANNEEHGPDRDL